MHTPAHLNIPEQPFFNVVEFAALCRRSRRWVHTLIDDGKAPARTEVGGLPVFTRASVIEWFQALEPNSELARLARIVEGMEEAILSAAGPETGR